MEEKKSAKPKKPIATDTIFTIVKLDSCEGMIHQYTTTNGVVNSQTGFDGGEAHPRTAKKFTLFTVAQSSCSASRKAAFIPSQATYL